jgi:hypothetical protein
MKIKNLFPMLAAGLLLCGCNKQTKLNTEKIETLTQNVAQFQQSQAKQLADLQAQLTALAPTLDKMNDFYFERSHDQAFFFHTNTLYLILNVDKNIESLLSVANTERAAENKLAYACYTNQMGTLYLCTAVLQEAVTNSESRIEENVNAETRRLTGTLSLELQKQIIQSATDPAGVARQKLIMADVADIKADLELIKAKLGLAAPK